MSVPADTPERQLRARTRRGFFTLAAGAAGAVAAWSWLTTSAKDAGTPYPLRRVLEANESLQRATFSPTRLARQYPVSAAEPEPRVNGDIGNPEDADNSSWSLAVQGAPGSGSSPVLIRNIALSDIRALPKVEQVTELNCIEGWTEIVHWAGVRFSDFTAKYAPEWKDAPYVGMHTPDKEYFVGLDAASAMHPQTLLCYEMNGQPLSQPHGAPLRLVIPVKYGIKNIKRIGTITYARSRTEDYWAQRGYDWYAGL